MRQIIINRLPTKREVGNPGSPSHQRAQIRQTVAYAPLAKVGEELFSVEVGIGRNFRPIPAIFRKKRRGVSVF